MKWSLLQKIPLKSSRKKHSKHANFQISINKNNINTIFHLPRLFEKSVSAWCFFYGRSLRRMSMERRSAGQKRNGNVWKKRRRFLIRVSPDDLNSLGWELVVERFPNQWWWLVVAGVDDSRSSCWVFLDGMKCRQIFQRPKFSPLFCSQKGSNNVLKSSHSCQWRGVHAVPASHGTYGTWARNTEEPSPRRPHGGSQPWGRWGTLLGFQSFHPLGWWRCSVTWMSYIVIHTKKKSQRFPETKNQELVFWKFTKIFGTCVFFGGGWPGSMRTIMLFFFGGENLICCG